MIKQLITWSHKEFSQLPWRKDRSLYSTLVSEIMLQQTTVSTVLKHYERFLKQYPDIASVAKASDEQLTASWKGLGYYRRARNLKRACEYFCEYHNGEIPLSFESLISAPGIGDYTANAILSIGANQRALALDANLERVLSRLYGVETKKGPKLLKRLGELFDNKQICEDMNQGGARDYNEALMDLGRTYCKANRASCELCPMSTKCVAYKENRALFYPVRETFKRKEQLMLELLRIIVIKDGKVLAYKKGEKEWLSGQWELPTFILNSQDKNLTQYPVIIFPFWENLPEYKTSITKYKISNKSVILGLEEIKFLKIDITNFAWIDPEVNHLSTGSLKAMELLL